MKASACSSWIELQPFKRKTTIRARGGRSREEFRGALVENFVAQQLVAGGQKRLRYWTSAGGMAEVDFLMEKEGTMFPLEAKSGVNPRSKSLRSFSEQFSGSRLSRTNLLNLRCDGSIDNYPLYAIGRFPDLRVALGANAEER
jgi:predicted AAA+ superfamily ATPase